MFRAPNNFSFFFNRFQLSLLLPAKRWVYQALEEALKAEQENVRVAHAEIDALQVWASSQVCPNFKNELFLESPGVRCDAERGMERGAGGTARRGKGIVYTHVYT